MERTALELDGHGAKLGTDVYSSRNLRRYPLPFIAPSENASDNRTDLTRFC